ncbi:hypothetical protein [Burkholderia ubonensis]|uniref:hypothetical protein n=1 Tax=Burkholderia ubonensis TaxID=101571 RepID=UPI0005DA4CB4|nr:hypothetical protein [Burkholderia ubonensis]AJX16762.1 hypothetical protein BW23_166 [Burkholderia ubonensis MSMB22]
MKNLLWTMTALIAGSLLSACSNKTDQTWIATKNTPVYASESDTEQKILFTLNPGDACTPVRDVVMKEYLHTEIACPKGRGWVIDKQNFEIKAAK